MRLKVLLLSVACGGASMAHAASFTYNVNDTFSTFSVSGTITTSKNTGSLQTTDITGWDLALNDGTRTLRVDTNNSQELVVGNGLSATAIGLFFDFGGDDGNQLIFQRPYIMYGTNDLCYQDQGGGCDATPGSHEAIMIRQGTEQVQDRVGLQQIAAAPNAVTPEPASLTLLGTGLLGTAGVLRRRLFA